jgi:hypothetical protein
MNSFNKIFLFAISLLLFSSDYFIVCSQTINPSESSVSEHPAKLKLPGYVISPYFSEQICSFNFDPDIRILINAPASDKFKSDQPTKLVLFALPNGNTIEQTIGKTLNEGDDWHFGIQHIGAQTRFLRELMPENNLVVIYLETSQKSWPLWKSKYKNYNGIIDSLVTYLTELFSDYNPDLILTGHSGGGSFTFDYLDGVTHIPNNIERISFLDSNYGYEDKYGPLIVDWLNESSEHYLSVLAYNDSIALYNDKPVVSAKGGTWFRSKMIQEFLDDYFEFTTIENSEFIIYSALDSRIKIILKKNPERLILHTVQVELNGFIQSMLSGTGLEGKQYNYYGERVYSQFIQDEISLTNILMIPPRSKEALTGSQIMEKIFNLPFQEREQEIFKEISNGNIPEFLRTLTKITSTFADSVGINHVLSYEAMSDYLAIGADEDFCRIPMGPKTAQKIADLYGAVLPTRKLVDDIYKHSFVKLEPVTYKPIGDENTFVSKFAEHNQAIQNQFIAAGGILGQLTGGIKKDLVLSNLIADSTRKNNVVIYGWHKKDGFPIQPLTNIHKVTYVDYSHGVRLISEIILIDGKSYDIKSVLQDPKLYKILSDENESMITISY